MTVITADRGAVWTGDAGLSKSNVSFETRCPANRASLFHRGRQMGRKSANMDTFLRGLDAKAPMGPLCGASKARATRER